MARKFALAVVLLLMLSMLFCSAVYAQEEQPTTTGEEPTTAPTGTEEPTPGYVYFYLNGELAQVERDITGGNQMAEFTLLELLKGPSEEELSAGYVTYIPEGVKLQYTTIKQDRSEYSVNLSREMLELSGDPDAASKALNQIVKTLQDATGIQTIGITIAGEGMGDSPIDAYEALGVTPAQEESTETSGGGNAWIVILIVSVAVLAVVVLFLVIYIRRKRRGSESRPQAKKRPAKKPADKKKAKK